MSNGTFFFMEFRFFLAKVRGLKSSLENAFQFLTKEIFLRETAKFDTLFVKAGLRESLQVFPPIEF